MRREPSRCACRYARGHKGAQHPRSCNDGCAPQPSTAAENRGAVLGKMLVTVKLLNSVLEAVETAGALSFRSFRFFELPA